MESIDLSQAPTSEQLIRITEWLAGADYRVIRPMTIRTAYCTENPPEKLITVAILDTETTGTNPTHDKIIELGMLLGVTSRRVVGQGIHGSSRIRMLNGSRTHMREVNRRQRCRRSRPHLQSHVFIDLSHC